MSESGEIDWSPEQYSTDGKFDMERWKAAMREHAGKLNLRPFWCWNTIDWSDGK
jgi:hypothetical protein